MKLRTSVAVLVAAGVFSCSASAAAQQIENGELNWDISVEDAEYLGNPARTYKRFESLDCLN